MCFDEVQAQGAQYVGIKAGMKPFLGLVVESSWPRLPYLARTRDKGPKCTRLADAVRSSVANACMRSTLIWERAV